MDTSKATASLYDVAVIGMAGRFPGARSIDQFWENLKNGVESISFFSVEELEASGVPPVLLRSENYVRAGAFLEGIDLFDADFFGITPREAEIMDPQHRLFLECSWEALENAGYAPDSCRSSVGVFAGSGRNDYIINIYSNPQLVRSVGGFQIGLGNDKDHLTTRVSYKLNLRGPSLTLQTACSTSLVAISTACQSLIDYQCDMALAGGVTIAGLRKTGYRYVEGAINSPDGHCRAFDARAQGTVGGDGVGVVVLKRLEDALAENDTILAVIRGWAVNNDGSVKVGYTAPSIDGQAAVIAEALEMAKVAPESINYIEAHGTGTSLGDPIEIAALTKAYREKTDKKNFCAIGSVKTNIGHLDAAAGVTGLIKTVLALKHKIIPPILHFDQPNPRIDFDNSPFYVNHTLREWKNGTTRRRAGVSSFGVGGTNAHLIVEEAPPRDRSTSSRPWSLIVLSAKTKGALEAAAAGLAEHLKRHPEIPLADIAFTSQNGRSAFNYRLSFVCKDSDDACAALRAMDPSRVFISQTATDDRDVVFLFPGQGAQYVNMAADLYRFEPLFRRTVNDCCDFLSSLVETDLRSILYPAKEQTEKSAELLDQTFITQPALFVIEYALAKLWMSWGVRPQAMLGHSVGEYVAACLAGVFSLEDALRLVALRGRLIQEAPQGSMMAVPLPEKEIEPLLGATLSLAAVNAPSLSVVSGPTESVKKLQQRLRIIGIDCQFLRTSHAFHSKMMEPVLEPFARVVSAVQLRAPKIPYISNLSGDWVKEQEATDPGYWVRHLRGTVRFGSGVEELLRGKGKIFLEVGPGRALASFARQQRNTSGQIAHSSLGNRNDQGSALAHILTTLGRLWGAGVKVDWSELYSGESRWRAPLPTYPFQRQRFWAEQRRLQIATGERPRAVEKKSEISKWFYAPSWKTSVSPDFLRREPSFEHRRRWLVFCDQHGIGEGLAKLLESGGQEAICVRPGSGYARQNDKSYMIDPLNAGDYRKLLRELEGVDSLPRLIAYFWNLEQEGGLKVPDYYLGISSFTGFYSLIFLARSLGAYTEVEKFRIAVISNHTQKVIDGEILCPDRATALSACQVMSQEYSNIDCRSIDVTVPAGGEAPQARLIEQIVTELISDSADQVIAFRGGQRWVRGFELLELRDKPSPLLRDGGVYLITGGRGSVGLSIAKFLTQKVKARLILTGRSWFPAANEWEEWLATHDDRDRISKIIRAARELEESGSEVILPIADVADEEQMRSVIAEVYKRFGNINGVIHAAGIFRAGNSRSISEITIEDCQSLFRAKAAGVCVLARVLQKQELDFCVLMSSLAAILGGLGSVAYAAANLFMDAFAEIAHQTGMGNWTSVNWDGWRFDEKARADSRTAVAGLAMTASEGIEAFQHLLSIRLLPQITISTADLRDRLNPRLASAPVQGQARNENHDSISLYARPNLQNDYLAPSNSLEKTIVEVWQELLGIDQIGVNDNFFELGGHSLLITQLVARLRKILALDIPLRTVFEAPTVAELARRVDLAAGNLRRPRINPIAHHGEAPLSFAQQHLWILDQLEPGNPAYNLRVAVRLIGALNILALEEALNALIERHEVLRTKFVNVDDRPIQIVLPSEYFRLPIIDLTELSLTERAIETRRLSTHEAERPFNLSEGNLLRGALIRSGEDDHALLFIMHHIIGDAWSMGVILNDVTAIYGARLKGEESPLPELPIQYRDFARWQREWLQGDALDRQLSYWKKQLDGAPPILDLPVDRPRPSVQSYRGASKPIIFSETLSARLRSLSLEEDATLFMTLLAAFNILLYHYTAQEDIVIGAGIANRDIPEAEELVGFFVNTLPLRTDLSGEPSYRELLQRVREMCLAAYDHQELPVELLVEAIETERIAGYSPLFQVMFDLQTAPKNKLPELPGVKMSLLGSDNRTSKFDLTLFMQEGAAGISGSLEYNTDLFYERTITRLVKNFQALLESVVEDPDRQIDSIPLVTEEEGQQLVESWSM
jgi:acyl transferase domain-containing protein